MNFSNYTIKSQEVLQKASEMVVGYGQQVVQTSHILMAILNTNLDIFSFLAKKAGTDLTLFKNKLKILVEGYPKVDGGQPYLSTEAHQALQHAEKFAKKTGDDYIAIEHLLLGLQEVGDVTSNLLREGNLNEKSVTSAINDLRGGMKADDQNAEAKYRSLERFSINLNQLAREGKIDPVIGCDEEIRRVLQILSRRTKNNPLLIGEPGVGKTAIVEGMAQRIISGDVPENLKTKTLISLDMGLLVAGAKYKGEFEERLKSVVREVKDSDGEVILFIDEIHTLIGAGSGGESAMDAANLLKPALARGELRAIGATTRREYQKYIEKDKALERRFQIVAINEPSVANAVSILRGIKEKYEVHHGVRIKDDAVIAAVELSNRYISDRFLPDKAIDLMDEAASKLRIAIDSMPEALDELNRKIMQLEIEREAIRREKDNDKEAGLSKAIAKLAAERNELKAKWEIEKEVIHGIRKEKEGIDALKNEADNAERSGDLGKVAEIRYGKIVEAEKRLGDLNIKLDEMHQAGSILKEEVDGEDIAEIVAKWTGVPLSKMLQSEKEKLLNLESELSKRIAGQREAIVAVSDAVRRSRAGLQDPKRPIGSFLFLGTTGIGKTELAKVLAEYLFNDENATLRIDMSEYQERHAVSRLIGAPPGYVGYDEGGQLTEAVRRNPYSVILLDEIEKAHPDIFNILLQVLDDGHLTDSKGRVVNFKNAIIIMTSNIGSAMAQTHFEKLGESNREEILEMAKSQVFDLLKKSMRPEFLNRIDEVIMFSPLQRTDLTKIANIQFRQIQKRLEEKGIKIEADNKVMDHLGKNGFDPQYGARPLKRILQKEILNELSKSILSGKIRKESLIGITLSPDKQIEFINLDEIAVG